jgi:predicted permease
MRNFIQDFRYGLRTLAAKPGFTIAAVIVLALGIGANTAVFSLVNAFLLKPIHVDKPQQLTGVYIRDTKKPDTYRAFSYPNYVDLRKGNAVFTSLMAHDLSMVGVQQGDTTRRVFADIVSSNYFSTLGVPLYKGRTFTANEEQAGRGAPVVIASYQFWRKQGADPDLVGKTLRVNGTLFTVVGIAAEGFSGTTAMFGGELYLPLGVYSLVMNDFESHGRPLAARDNHALIVVGRLRPGLSGKDADPQLAVVASQLASAYPAENKDQTFIARPLSRMSISTSPTDDNTLMVPAAILLSMAAVVLLIASLNIANMMLARGTARRREIAIRLAIGGQRRRIVQQLLTEGLLLSLIGGSAGIALASWSTALLIRSISQLGPIDPIYSGAPDVRVMAATLGFCVLSTMVFALGPAWKLSSPELATDLRESIAEEAGGARRLFSRRNVLVMGQLSLSLMMLVAAGLFVSSATRAAHVEPGFALDRGVLAEVDPSLAGYGEQRGRQIYADLLARLRRIPGIESVSLAATVPFGMMSEGRNIQLNGKTVPVRSNIVTADYFQTLGIPLLQGRAFQTTEPTHALIIDKLAASKLWPDANAVGRHVRLESEEAGKPAEDYEVVGVVGIIKERLIGGGLEPHAYLPFGRSYQANMQIHLKVTPGVDVMPAVRAEIRAVDERLPLLGLKTLRDHLDASFDLWVVRAGATMLAIFGVVALLLAVIGLYGVKAYTVARRTREIGIRMALGATSSDALNLILREGMMVTLVGLGVGMVLAVGLGKLLSGFLYEVHAVEPLVLLTAPVILTAVSLLASYLPARRAARVDPTTALRYE